ncbi:SdpI family protein [Clostridium sp.]|uniref:SdpI family protein n=1 Tax=Clostridium sp. TaxID=1506 RepID=UPI00258BDF9A|nr:SdpI family protein [Clostridium sp.]MDF2505960.1 hypothetical protein [Clostridium sp.]
MKKIVNTLKRDWIVLIIIILQFVLGAYFYKSLPNKIPIPIHWNGNGEADSYAGTLYGIFSVPLISFGIYILFIILPFIDPKRENYKKFNSTYNYLKYILIIFLFIIEGITILASTKSSFDTAILVKIMGSLLLILIGNVMGRFKHNYFVGIKTPWTLASEEVWRKTHRMAAPVWVIGGIINMFISFTRINLNIITPIIIVIIAVIPMVYSYIIYHKMSKGI